MHSNTHILFAGDLFQGIGLCGSGGRLDKANICSSGNQVGKRKAQEQAGDGALPRGVHRGESNGRACPFVQCPASGRACPSQAFLLGAGSQGMLSLA